MGHPRRDSPQPSQPPAPLRTFVPRPERGGFLSVDIVRAIIAQNSGIPVGHLDVCVDASGVTFWDKRCPPSMGGGPSCVYSFQGGTEKGGAA